MSNIKETAKQKLKLSFGEEVANSTSHGLMSLLALFALPYVAVKAYLSGGVLLSASSSIFVISIFMMFLGSTLYHAMAFDTQHKFVFRILDHIFIYVAIAGTYTPIALYAIGGKLGWFIVIVQWLMVLFGILYKSLSRKSIPTISVTIYLVMGWMAVLLIPSLIKNTSSLFLALIVLGGVLYSIGTWFYMRQERPYYHTVWHLFINLAATAHFIAIVFVM
ncbi:hemolysin III family protein [Erysipelothrix urinaevulpis]|uniref:PAQR family membrane homeostasis protein TrhA n=1 Tax=Erysipelothrix urinaevulpis TaxID=2683717 RepID=UPI0013579424|nr:hemolysin III family protein [Erysipelothrix urinaevulpis]